MLLVYALALSNYAHSILASLPTFEAPQDGKGKGKSTSQNVVGQLTSEDEKRISTGLGRAVDLLCQASGVATCAADKVCPLLEAAKKATGGRGKGKWPVETGTEAFRGLGM